MKFRIIIAVTFWALLLAPIPGSAQPQYPGGYYGQQQNWHGVLSASDQNKFDDAYSKWVDATRKNDQDEVRKNAQHMQDIMSRNNIPQNVPFDVIATNPGPAYGNQAYGYPNGYPSNGYPNNGYPNNGYPNSAYPNGAYPANGQSRLSPDDQKKFDNDYEHWVDAQRKNDQDDVMKNAQHMQEIMSRYNIPQTVPFAAIATNGYAAGPNGAAGYPSGYPSSAYPYGYGQGPQRLSSKDQKDFDKDYKNWVDARRKKDMDDMDKNARKMQEIMTRYNIPANVPFDQIASAGSAYR